MSAYLYYRRFSPVIADAYYDRIALEVVKEWDQLDKVRQWQLGSREELSTTGHHFKITSSTEYGALSWHLKCRGNEPQGYSIREDEWKEGHGIRWVSAEPIGIKLKKPKPIPKETKPQQMSLF